MATEKPRIAVTLEQHRYDLLKRLAAAQGVSMSHLVSDLLEAVAEPLERVCVLLESAKKAPQEVKDGLRAAAEHSERTVFPLVSRALDQLDMFLGVAESSVSAASGRPADAGSASAARRADPRPVTRGSTTPTVKANKHTKPPRKPSSAKAFVEKRG